MSLHCFLHAIFFKELDLFHNVVTILAGKKNICTCCSSTSSPGALKANVCKMTKEIDTGSRHFLLVFG